MIFDPKISALYGDDGSFIKTVHCPMALRVNDLQALDDSSPDRLCHSCGTTVRCIDKMSEAAVREAVTNDENVCVFATAKAKHVVFLQPIGRPSYTAEQLPRIQTVRTLAGMADAFARGMRLIIKYSPVPNEIGVKYKVFQHNVTGEVWWSGDYRSEWPDGPEADWTLIADWFYHRPDWPFPLAAYQVPPGLRPGQRVLLEDLIEDVGMSYWNQGNSDRLLSCVATWNGDEFELEVPQDLPMMVG